MLSKNKIKLIHGLSSKKKRDELNLFCAEGEKCVLDLLSAFECDLLLADSEWIESHAVSANEVVMLEGPDEMRKISFLTTPSSVFAVFRKPPCELEPSHLSSTLSVVLDNVQDPGNLGTIVRVCDWFGIRDLVCSETTVDIFNPKAMQATMGAAARVRLHYLHLPDFFTRMNCLNPDYPVYGTFLDGDDIYKTTLNATGAIVMGNEGKGISKEVEAFVTQRLRIPSFPQGVSTSESLNVAMATGIVCSEFRRRS